MSLMTVVRRGLSPLSDPKGSVGLGEEYAKWAFFASAGLNPALCLSHPAHR